MNGLRARGQSLVEFALILPIFVLIVIGVFDLGRAFFAYIAITNAAREGARVYTFDREHTTIADIYNAVDTEIGSSTVVNPADLELPYLIECYNEVTSSMQRVTGTFTLSDCTSEEPFSVTITYTQSVILSFFFPDGITLVRTAEMMAP